MASAAAKPTYTSGEEYIAEERKAAHKSEYYEGQVCAMAGATCRHNLIAGNLYGEVREQLKAGPCEVYVGDMRVHVDPTGSYCYPDVVAVCGEPEFRDGESDTLLNPTLIVEVPSPSTEAYLCAGGWTIRSFIQAAIAKPAPKYETMAPEALRMSQAGAGVLAIAAALGMSPKHAAETLSFARTGVRPKFTAGNRTGRGPTGKRERYKQIAPLVKLLRDQGLTWAQVGARLAADHDVKVCAGTIVRAYVHADPSAAEAAKNGERPTRGRPRLLSPEALTPDDPTAR